tara:strand:+ start:164 stop:520 length:357 start_codon:yes stop_codon:yes gene_type:complete
MEFISAIKYGFKNYANTKALASRSQLYYWFLFALISLTFCTLLDIIFFNSNTYSQLLELNKPVGWFTRIWFWSIFTPSITIIIRRIKDLSQPIWRQSEFIDIPVMVIVLLIMLFLLAY